MARDDRAQLEPIEALALGLAEAAAAAVLESLAAGGYRPTDEQLLAVGKLIAQASRAMPCLVDWRALTAEELREAARGLGVLAVREVLGPPPGLN